MTTPELEALGLGYFFWWSYQTISSNSTGIFTMRSDSATTVPSTWLTLATGNYTLTATVRVSFVKIGPMPDTGGSQTTINIPFSPATLHVAEKATPPVHVYTHTILRTLTRFASAKRACTPTVNMNQTIMFPTISESNLPAPGNGTNDYKQFTLKWNCPYMAYDLIGFNVQATYGYADTALGIIKNNPGTGYAKGVGIQVEGLNLRETGWNSIHSSGWMALKPNTFYSFKALDFVVDEMNTINGMTENRNVEQQFRARLYRLNEPLVPGTIQYSILIHMVYR